MAFLLEQYANTPTPATPNTPWTTLNGAILAGATSFTVVSHAPFPAVAQFRVVIDNELYLVTAGSSTNTWTVTPGIEGTTSASHANGAGVFLVLTAASQLRNPRSMTTLGDMEYMGALGAPTRLASPADGTYNVLWASGAPSWAVASGTIGGAIAATQVAFGTGVNTIGGNGLFTIDPTTSTLTLIPTLSDSFTDGMYLLVNGANQAASDGLNVNYINTATVDGIAIQGITARVDGSTTNANATIDGMASTVYIHGGGVQGRASVFSAYPAGDTGPIPSLSGFYLRQPILAGGSAITDAYAFYTEALGSFATNAYAFWSDDQGVGALKSVNDFDSVQQANWRIYNPLFTKYVAGATNREYIVSGQWNGNVGEIGTVATGTGTLRTLRLIGNALNVVPAATFNSTVTATDFNGGTWNSKTFTLAGNTIFTGAFNPTFAIPSSSTWTFPSGGGTLSTTTGTVTSVALTVPTFLSIAGSPIISTGTLAITLSGTALPVANGGTGITSFGTGVATALGVNVGSAGAVVTFNGALGTPSSGTLTNATGLPEGGLALTDITTANVSATAHGFVPKFPNNTTTFFRGDGTYAAVSGAAGGTVTSIATTSPISGGTITSTGTISLLVNTDFAFTAGQTITAPAGATALTLTGGTQTTSFPVLSATQTWNAAGVAFKGLIFTVTNTASAAGARTLELVTGSTSEFSVDVSGNVISNGNVTATNGTVTGFVTTTSSSGHLRVGAGASINMDTTVGYNAANGIGYNFHATSAGSTPDTFMIRGGAAATVQYGQDVNGAAISQMLQAANGITGTDKTGGNFTIASGKGTGAGAVSSLIFQTPTVLTTGTTAQSLATRLTISSASLNHTVPIAFGGNLAVSNAVPTIASGFGSGATIAGIVGGFRITVGTVPGVGGTVNFNTTFANAPVCFVQDETTGVLGIAAPTTTTVVISGLTLVAGQTVCVFCFGY